MNFCLSLALGLGLSFLAQEFLPAVPWAYEARLLLVPVVFFACAVALRFPVMLLFAFATGFVWDARHLVIDTAPVGALSTPVFVYDATVKYQVPALSPSIRAVVVAALAMSSTVDNSVGDVP